MSTVGAANRAVKKCVWGLVGEARLRVVGGVAGSVALALLAAGCGSADGWDTQGATEEGEAASTASESSGDVEAESMSPEELRIARMEVLENALGEELANRLVQPTASGGAAVWELQLQNGNVVSWHEPTEGVVMTFEVGEEPALTPDAVRQLSAVELFHVLAPEAETPAVLEDLDARRVELEPIFEAVRELKDEHPILAVQALDDTPVEAIAVDESSIETNLEPSFELPEAVGQVRSPLSTSLHTLKNRRSTSACANDCLVSDDTVLDYRRTEQKSTQSVSKNDVDWIDGTVCAVKKTITVKVETRPWWSWSTALTFQAAEGKERTFTGATSGASDTDLRHTWSMGGSSHAAGCANMEDW